MKKISLLILAAGIGSRYGGLKQLDPIGLHGALLLDYAIWDAQRAGFCRVVFLISHRIEADFKKFIGSRYKDFIDVGYAFQELDSAVEGCIVPSDRIKPWGTGHAVLAAREAIGEPFAVINSDDYYGPQSFQLMARFLETLSVNSTKAAMVGFLVQRTLSEHGKVSRGICTVEHNKLRSVVEREKIYAVHEKIYYDDAAKNSVEILPDTLVSMNLWGFAPETIFNILQIEFRAFLAAHSIDKTAEFYLPAAINGAIQVKHLQVTMLHTSETWFGLTYPEDKEMVKQQIRDKVSRGVYPEKLF